MLRLIQNEYLKLLKKKSTWAIIIIVALLAVGFCSIFAVNMKYSNYDYDLYKYTLEQEANDFFSDQNEYKRQGYDSKETNGEYKDKSEYADEMRMRAVYYRFVLDNNLEREDWRITTNLVQNLCNYKYVMLEGDTEIQKQLAQTEYNKIKAVFDADDWKSYYNAQLDQLKATYKDNQLLLKANSWFFEYSIENDLKPGGTLWITGALSTASRAKIDLVPYLEKEAAGEKINAKEKEELLNTAATQIYRIEHNIENDLSVELIGENFSVRTMWGVFSQSKSMVTVIGVLIIVVAGSIVSSEFAQGTIKFLLINPVKRWKILVAKYITAISYGAVLLIVLYAISGICAMIFTGFAGVNDKLVIANNGVARSVLPMFIVMNQYLLAGINVIVMATLAFALSSVARSSALAVSISMLSLLVGSIVVEVLAMLKIDWARYLIFANLNLAKIYNGDTLFPNQSFPFSVFIVIMHVIIFFMIAWDGFTRREV
jgi:ABC-2 type transport system permease protein